MNKQQFTINWIKNILEQSNVSNTNTSDVIIVVMLVMVKIV